MPVVTEGKTLLEAVENAKNELKTEKIYYTFEEEKNGLFKGENYKVNAVSFLELMEEIKKYLKQAVNGLGLTVNFETNIKEEDFNIVMFSDNNSILIGKNGSTLKALQTLSRAMIKMKWGISLKILLDVEKYREKRVEALERIAIKTAQDVRDTKIDVILENMNSYERRIIHNKLSNFKGITTTSEGEEPNRHIVIKAE